MVVDLVCIVGLYLVGVICEVMNEDGTMVCVFDFECFVKLYKIKMVVIVDFI